MSDIDGHELVARIDLSLMHRNQRRKALCEAVGISSQSVTDWDKKNTKASAETLLHIADFLNVSMRWLLTGEAEDGSLTQDEGDLLAMYRAMNSLARKALLRQVEIALEHEVEEGKAKAPPGLGMEKRQSE
jgi:transcriptional regulator with XRE-family HTH domain